MNNEEIFKREIALSRTILQRNRHRSVDPYEWFGPDPEPNPDGADCECAGCDVRRSGI